MSGKTNDSLPPDEALSDTSEVPLPTLVQLDTVSKTTEVGLAKLLRIALVIRQLSTTPDEDQIIKVSAEISQMHTLLEELELPICMSVLKWLGKVQTKAILIGPRLWCCTRHHAVIRTCRNYIHWWHCTLKSHNKDTCEQNANLVEKFAKCIVREKLFLSKRSVWQWGAKLKVETANAKLLLEQLTPRLSFKERMIVDALRKAGEPMNGEKLLAAAKLAVTGSHKEILAGLDDRGVIIANRGAGYHLPEWLLSKSRT